MAKQKLNVTAVGMYGAGASVRSEIKIMLRNGNVYIQVSDNESGANNRTSKIALSRERMRLIGRTLMDLADGNTLDQCTKWGHWNTVTRTADGNGV